MGLSDDLAIWAAAEGDRGHAVPLYLVPGTKTFNLSRSAKSVLWPFPCCVSDDVGLRSPRQPDAADTEQVDVAGCTDLFSGDFIVILNFHGYRVLSRMLIFSRKTEISGIPDFKRSLLLSDWTLTLTIIFFNSHIKHFLHCFKNIFLVLNELVHECIMGTGPDNKRGRGRLAPSRVYYQGRFP